MKTIKSPRATAFSLNKLSAALTLTLSTTLISTSAIAAGLGKLTVFSGLGQPLRAEIEVTAVGKDEADSLAVRLAALETFRQANIEFNGVLRDLRFVMDKRGDRHVVRISSSQPINEPFVDLLVELNWNSGRLVREYTFLLDPPELKSTRAESVTGASVQSVPDRNISKTELTEKNTSKPSTKNKQPKVENTPSENKPIEQKPAPQSNASGDEVQVKSGDTLGKIAAQVKPEGVSLDQMLVALYKSNSGAFINNNMNLLRSGAILKVPNASTAQAISTSEARKEVVTQTSDFNAYRAKLSGAVASSKPAAAESTGSAASGKITTEVKEKAAPKAESQDKLVLSKAGTGKTDGKADAKAAAEAARLNEEKIAKDKALKEAQGRVNDLEKNVNELQKTLEAKNKALADAQKKAETKVEPPKVEPKTEPKIEAKSEPKVEAKPTAPAITPPATPTAPAAPIAPAPEAAKVEPPKAENSAPAVNTPITPATPTVEAPKPTPTPEKPAPKPAPAAPVVESPSFFSSLKENPVALYGGLGGLAALLGYGAYSISRKRKFQKFEDSIITGGDLRPNSIFGSTGGQSVDTNSVFNTSFSPSQYQPDTNEVDPVAEADVYIAYGREAQAEEILKEALKIQPDRQAIRLKLLEIYANRNDAAAFETVAGELYSMTNGDCEEWPKAAAMGLKIDPQNPLYKNALSTDGQGVIAAVATGAAALATDNFGNAQAAEDEPFTASPMPDTKPMDFDLDINQAMSSPDLAIETPEATDLDFDLGAPATAEPLAEAVPEFKAPELPTLDLDLNSKSPAMMAAAEEELKMDIPPLEMPDFSNTASLSAEPLPPADLADINLDLDPGVTDADAWQEMATKLDLAKAYLEIGDKEGAQELLEEVVSGGDAEQQGKARSMLAEIA